MDNFLRHKLNVKFTAASVSAGRWRGDPGVSRALIFSSQSPPGGDSSRWTRQPWRASQSASTARWEESPHPQSPGPSSQVRTSHINDTSEPHNLIPIPVKIPKSETNQLFQLFITSPLQPLRDKNFHSVTSCKLLVGGGKFDILFCLSRQTEEYLHRHWTGRSDRGHSDHWERDTRDMAGGSLRPGRVLVCCQQ